MNRIILKNVSKKFKIGYKKDQGALSRFVSACSGREHQKTIWALKNISFSVKKGEIAGIIGKNGSGKSTLLRLIAGIYYPNEGHIQTSGKIVSLINLYSALKERLTLKENLYLYAAYYSLKKSQINQRIDYILNFTQLDDFVDTKVYQFSTGMKQRLIFTVAMECSPEIILIDEDLEVGDINFKTKCIEKIKDLTKKGASVIIASHGLQMLERICQNIIWLNNGGIEMVGGKHVIKDYFKISN